MQTMPLDNKVAGGATTSAGGADDPPERATTARFIMLINKALATMRTTTVQFFPDS